MKIIVSMALWAVAASAVAAETVQQEVVVTAARGARTVDETLASVTVLTREEIARSQAPDLVELLRMQAGVDLTRTGGPGQTTGLLLRGTASNQTLVLIDGIRVASTNSGLYDFAHLPLDQIERIEIVRGPRASYWGSDALGGVIQVFTRQPRGPVARVHAGTDDRLGGSAGYGASGERGSFGVTLGHDRFGGYSAQNEAGFSFDPDDDEYRNRTASLRGSTRVGEHELAASFLTSDAEVDFDQGTTSATDRSGGITLSGPLGSRVRHHATLGATRGEIDTPAFFNRFESERATLDWQAEFEASGSDTLALGVNLAREKGRTLDTFAGEPLYDEDRDNRAVHGSWRRRHEALDLELAARHDDNSAFGSEATYQAAVGWRLGPAWRVSASGGEGFRAPSLNELYSPGFGGLFAGDPDLQPEASRSVELGLDYRPDRVHRASLRAFRTRVRDLIAFEGGETFRAINVRRASIDGAELGYEWRGETLRVDAHYTWQDARDDDSGQLLVRRPRQKLALAATRSFGPRLDLGVEALGIGRRRDIATELPGFALFSLRAAWRFTPVLRLEGRLENAFDRDYELAHGFNTPGRTLTVALVYGE